MELNDAGPGAPTELSPVDLPALLGTDEEPFLLDVRQPEEVAAWASAGVVNGPIGEREHRLAEVPAARQVVVVCAAGSRSSQAAAFLARAGYRALNLTGGMA